MENQRTPSKPVGDGLAREIGRMMEDAARKYNGGTERMDLVKGHPQFIGRVYELWEKLFVEQKHRLEIMSGFRPIWRTINLGTGLSSEREFVDAMKDKGIINVSYPERGFGSAVFIGSSELTSVDLVIASMSELGCSMNNTFAELFEAANSVGLSICQPEVGPQLRLQYLDQQDYASDEFLWVAMEPVEGYYQGDNYICCIYHRSGAFGFGSQGASLDKKLKLAFVPWKDPKFVFCRK